jgi:dTDP-4-dehydrorhamnose reductase
MIKKVLIVGSNGLLGQSLVNRFAKSFQVYKTSLESEDYIPSIGESYRSLDITSRSKVQEYLEKIKPEIIVNAAAYTNVDKSEIDQETCWNVNVKAVENIIEAAETFKPLLVQISTDYVFDGETGCYRETDQTNPKGVYARSKMAAENIVRTSDLDYIIARTQVLYGSGQNVRNNFATWVIEKLQNDEEIKVVGDQIGNPTYIDDLSEGLMRLIDFNEYGLFHISGSEIISRYNFALKIADRFDLDSSKIEKINTEDLNQQAPRPMNSSFILDKLVNRIQWEPSDIDSGLTKLKRKYYNSNG